MNSSGSCLPFERGSRRGCAWSVSAGRACWGDGRGTGGGSVDRQEPAGGRSGSEYMYKCRGGSKVRETLAGFGPGR